MSSICIRHKAVLSKFPFQEGLVASWVSEVQVAYSPQCQRFLGLPSWRTDEPEVRPHMPAERGRRIKAWPFWPNLGHSDKFWFSLSQVASLQPIQTLPVSDPISSPSCHTFVFNKYHTVHIHPDMFFQRIQTAQSLFNANRRECIFVKKKIL